MYDTFKSEKGRLHGSSILKCKIYSFYFIFVRRKCYPLILLPTFDPFFSFASQKFPKKNLCDILVDWEVFFFRIVTIRCYVYKNTFFMLHIVIKITTVQTESIYMFFYSDASYCALLTNVMTMNFVYHIF